MTLSANARLFDLNAADRDVALDAISIDNISDQQLLWIDLTGDDAELKPVAQHLGWPEALQQMVPGTTPEGA